MATPAMVLVTGTVLDANGAPYSGNVYFRTSIAAVSGLDDTFVLPRLTIVPLDVDGHFEVELPAGDDPDWAPVGWTYRVTLDLGEHGTQGPWDVVVPHQLASVSLADLAPVTESFGEIYALANHTHAGGGGGGGGSVDSVFGRTGAVIAQSGDYTKTQIGLGNVDNTSDAAKPISTDVAAALAGKSATGHTHAIGDTTGLQAGLDGKSPTGHNHDGSYSGTLHDHDLDYSTLGHGHAGVYQPLDLDLTAIAGLAPSDGALLSRQGGSWTGRTPAQVKTDLGLVKGDVGLGSVDNTSDASKPVSTAQQAALDLKADLASPNLTGTPAAPTAIAGTNTTQIATTAFVQTAVGGGGGGSGPGLPDNVVPVAGRWFSVPAGRIGANRTMELNRGFFAPLPIAVAGTIDQLAIDVAVAGSAGSVCRAVLWNADPVTRLPTTSFRDLGTVATDSTGIKSWTGLAQAVSSNTLYWVALIAGTATFGARAIASYNSYISGTAAFSGTAESSHMSMIGLAGAVANGTNYVHNSTENGPQLSVRFS